MFEQELLAEVLSLIGSAHPLSRTARQALGYKEVLDWIEAGQLTPGSRPEAGHGPPRELIELIQTRTRQFAKRQHTWFRNLEECVAINIDGGETPSELCHRVASRMRCRLAEDAEV